MRRGHEAGPGCKANCKPEGKARAGVVRGRGQEVEPTRSCKARGAGATQKAWLLQGGARGVARARRRGEQRQAEPSKQTRFGSDRGESLASKARLRREGSGPGEKQQTPKAGFWRKGRGRETGAGGRGRCLGARHLEKTD